MKKFSYLISYLFFRFFIFPFYIIPYRACLSLGRFLSRILYRLDERHRKIAYENIRYSFPDLSPAEVDALVREHYLHLGEMLADSLYVARMDEKWFSEYIILDEDFKALIPILEKTEKKLFISGHIGTWEVLLAWIGKYMNGGAIYKPVRNPFVDRWLAGIRAKSGAMLVPVTETFQAIKAIKKGVLMGFAADQNAGKAGIFVEFMNRPASTFMGPVVLANMSGARIFLFTCYRKEGKIRISGKELGEVNSEGFIDKDEMIRFYTEKWVKELEIQIRLHPEQYFWVHRRWRTKPGDFPGQK